MRSRRSLAAVLVGLLATGCAALSSRSELVGKRVRLPDGRVVMCVGDKGRGAGGVDCDWEHAAEPDPR